MMLQARNRGRLFAGRLFSGRLFGNTPEVPPVLPPMAGGPVGGLISTPWPKHHAPRRRHDSQDDEVLLFLLPK